MPRAGLKKVQEYSAEFKLAAVRLSRQRGVQVQAVAAALDITYVPVVGRWRFLAVVLDQCSRRVLAWALGRTRDAHLTRAVLDAAVRRRRPRPGLIFHSDRGSEYAAQRFRDRLRVLGIRQSVTRGRAPGDNAHMESFFHSLKAEVIHGARFATDRQLRLALRRYVWYYNHQRLHSALR